ncbi:c-type cytochrome [Marinicellulosiphila megalodicopiae]|uniref:c-type cytochrome n=1 Tax=Marinicellulosiphila megalodicopiae TaxID=2724896 RepID=UPI003BAFB9F4
MRLTKLTLVSVLSYIVASLCSAQPSELNTELQTKYKQYQSTLAAKKAKDLFQVPDVIHQNKQTQRWYGIERIDKGKAIYNQLCIGCHLKDGIGTENWQESLDEGGYPPPPLNGTAHTWHHPLGQLHEVIKYGLIEYGSSMPAWGAVLSDDQILDLIASFQSYWSDETYQSWLERH